MNSQQLLVENGENLADLRQLTRQILHELQAALSDQARVSWISDYIARQMLDFHGHGVITLTPVEEEYRRGLQISCEGDWLYSVGHAYEINLARVISDLDTIDLVGGAVPRLTVTSWLN